METQRPTQTTDAGNNLEGSEHRASCTRHGSRRRGRRLAGGAFILFLVLAAGFAGGFASRAFGFSGAHGFMSRTMDPAMVDERVERMVKHLAVEVDATPEQRERLTVIAKAAAKDLTPARAQWAEARRRGIELLSATTVDRAALEQLRVAQLTIAESMSQRLTRALGDAAEVLSVEQRKTLALRAQRFSEHHGGPRG